MISNREKEIIETMLKNPRSFLTIHHIAQTLGVSSRTIHRELSHVESTLKNSHLILERITNKGIRINGKQHDIEQLVNRLSEMVSIDFSLEERKVIIIYTLINAKDPVKLYSLASEVGISINKLNKELSTLNDELLYYKLSIDRRRGEGIVLMGSELQKRQFLADMMLEKLNSTSVYSVIEDHFVYQTLNDARLNDLVDMNQIFNVERLLMDALIDLPYVLTESAYLTLTLHIVLAMERIKHGEPVHIDEHITDSMTSTLEYKVASRIAEMLEDTYALHIELEEIIFITMHLRGAKRRLSDEPSIDLTMVTKQLIATVSNYSMIDFNNNTTLYEGVLLHLGPALNRLTGGIETFNPLTTMIKNDYPVIYNAVHAALLDVFPYQHFPAGEVAFLALHFGGAKRGHATNVLVVCTSGIGTSRILSQKIESRFPMVHVVGEASVSELKSLDLNDYEYIISTVALDITAPHVVVNPLLPDSDVNRLEKVFQMSGTKQKAIVKDVEYNDVLPFAVQGHELIQNIYYSEAVITDYIDYFITFLEDKGFVRNSANLRNALIERDYYGVLLTDSEVAIPHIVHSSITTPIIIMVKTDTIMRDMNGHMNHAKYLAYMALPSDSDIRALISELSLLIMENLSTPETLFNDESFVVSHMKQQLLQQLSKLLN